jgi:hypothetical protein
VQKKNYEPLKGINLSGVNLKGKLDNGKITDLESLTNPEAKNLAKKYKDWVQLHAAGDGNCLLHTFSVFLTGESNVDITLRLRVAICLEIMNNAKAYFSNAYDDKEEDIIRVLKNTIKDESLAKNRA